MRESAVPVAVMRIFFYVVILTLSEQRESKGKDPCICL